MSERQYIGARYVPQFATPIEWNDQTSYEALTIVTYLGASYTSRKAVPAGTLPTNKEYWALTGNYNAQVEEYRQQVEQYKQLTEEVKEDVSDLAKNVAGLSKKIVTIGDSYDLNTQNWQGWAYLFSMNYTWYTVYDAANGGAGFVTASPEGQTFVTALDTAYNKTPNPTEVTDVVVMGGYNDASMSQTAESINTAMANFKAKALNYFPNAKVHVGFLGVDNRYNGMQATLFNYCNIYRRAAAMTGFSFIENINYTLLNNDYILNVAGDANSGFHPNTIGNTEVARNLMMWLNGSDIRVNYAYRVSAWYLEQINGTASIGGLSTLNPNMVGGLTTTLQNNVWTPILALPCPILWGAPDGAGNAWQDGTIVWHPDGTTSILNLRFVKGNLEAMYNAGASLDLTGTYFYFSIPSVNIERLY